MDFDRYLKRIKIDLRLSPEKKTLDALLRAHLLNIPFEDLDIQSGVPIQLSTESFFEKIIGRNRGGYCYELNGLFHALLRKVGFDVHLISGRVVNGSKVGEEYDHLALIVNLDGEQWLVDAGYGDFSLIPLRLTNDLQSDGHHEYQIQKTTLDGLEYFSAEKWIEPKKAFIPDYLFTVEPRTMKEFAQMHDFHQTHPDSHFVKNLICSLPTSVGRVSMINDRLIIKEQDEKKYVTIKNMVERLNYLHKHFGIPKDAVVIVK
jgi:N-hydroxyarylamine O-acetyltransferase